MSIQLIRSLTLILKKPPISAFADETYKCDWYDMNAVDQGVGGGSFSVNVKTGGGAEVISIPQNPMANPYKAFDLDVYSQDGRIFTTFKIQDLVVSFTKSTDEKAGILRIQGTMPMPDGGISPAQSFICTK